ncbi:MAG: type I methionyl aminopeptidase [Candidatus Eisenbacteria bacterium]|nr:type I methionyl aminopeptidase [Candidatus Eisenbacteria bacterium]
MIPIKSKEEIKLIAGSSALVAGCLELVGHLLRPGISTVELDREVDAYIRKNGAVPAFKGYRGFPANMCVSVNHEVVHGIPGERMINGGDIVSVDIGVLKNGYYGDSARSFAVGDVHDIGKRLLASAEEALVKGIEKARPGNRVGAISHAIQSSVESNGFSVVRALSGHGIGKEMHEEPQIPNYGREGSGALIKEGMVFAIEPMVNAGNFEVEILDDGWTVVTRDRSLSAHFEHTVAVLSDGPEVLSCVG